MMIDDINTHFQPVNFPDSPKQSRHVTAGTLNQGIVDIKKSEKSPSHNYIFPGNVLKG
jgi:hypothetical protein